MHASTHGAFLRRSTAVSAIAVLALLMSLLAPQLSFANETVEHSVRVEATVTDEFGDALPSAVCVDVSLFYDTSLDGEFVESVFETDEIVLTPGTAAFDWEITFAHPAGTTFPFSELDVFVAECEEDEYFSASRSFSSVIDETLTPSFELQRITGIRADYSVTDGALPADDQCIQLYQYADGARTAASQKSFGLGSFTLFVGSDDLGTAFQYGVDACTFEEDVSPFPYEPVYFDDVSDLADATDVIIGDEGLVDLGTFLLSPSGDAPIGTVGGFSDVPVGFVHAEGILWLVEQSITVGIGDGLFGPGQPVTRGQMATFLDRALELADAQESAGFTDVPAGFVHAGAIDRLVDAGITQGIGDGLYGPAQPVTRGQMATFLFRALA